MFWKKETNSLNLLKTVFINLFRSREAPESDIFQFNSRERRRWFRVRPAEENPVMLRFEGGECRVHDIGAAGLSFKSDLFAVGETRSAELALPELGPPIKIPLEVLSIDTQNVCHCSFRNIAGLSVEKIHQYVLRRQKEILKESNKNRAKRKKNSVQR